VLFDLGNTLVYSHPEETFQKILAEYGIVKSLHQVREAMARGNQEFDIDKHTGLSAHEFYTKWNLVELKHLGLRGSKARKLAQQIDTLWWKYAELHAYPDVKETLQRLKQMGLKLGVITGGYEEDIENVLPKAGLNKFFDVCVGVNTTGKRKPNPKAFRYALKQLGIEPSEALFVGDNLEADYLGAEKVGMIPLLIKREGLPNQRLYSDVCLQPASNVRIIKRLDEIFEVLGEINP